MYHQPSLALKLSRYFNKAVNEIFFIEEGD